ncbi:MAG: hypothetical protein ACI9AF_000374 [Granulosicoccus sp.]|jgi:hypothetical protein
MAWVLTSTQDEVPEFRTRDLNEGGVSDAYALAHTQSQSETESIKTGGIAQVTFPIVNASNRACASLIALRRLK